MSSAQPLTDRLLRAGRTPAIRIVIVQTSPILDPEARVLSGLLTSGIAGGSIDTVLLAGVRRFRGEYEAAHSFSRIGLDQVHQLEIGRLRLPRRGWPDLVTKAARQCRLSQSVRALRPALLNFRPDVIYSSQQQLDVQIAARLAHVTGASQVIHVHYPWGPWLGRRAQRRLLEADGIIATSEFVRHGLVSAGVDPTRTFTVPNSMALPPLPASRERDENREAVRRELGLGPAARVVLMAARINPWKGQEDLAAAMLPILRREADVHLVFAGEEDPPGNGALGRLRALVGSETAAARIHLLGLRRDVPRLLLAADLFAHPSRDEAFGLAVLEAMAYEVPVVAWDQGATSEVVADGETGRLAPLGDIGALTRQMDELLGDARLRRRLGAAGRGRVASVYHPDHAARQFTGVLGTIVRRVSVPD